MGRSKVFRVTVKAKETVAAILPVQEHWLQLSNLDLLLPPLDVGVFFCYKKQSATANPLLSFATMVSTLKAALEQVLVTYYPFAGEIVVNSVGESELLCNDRGVDFIEAYADVELAELNLYDPNESVEAKLVPKKKKGVLCIQATELKCGGVVVACTFDHRVADAYSTNMFLVTWAETVRSKPLSRLPSFRRSFLAPRRPGSYDAAIGNLYLPISSIPPPSRALTECVNRIYYITAEDIALLQSSAGKGRTKLEAFTAYLWRLLAKSFDQKEKKCRMGVVIDGRSRLAASTNESMENYFGNVLSIPYGTSDLKVLHECDLSDVADDVHAWVSAAATGEHFLGLIDWVESRRPEALVASIYCEVEGSGPACLVSSGRRFPVREVEFGWGKPVFGSYHFPWGSSAAGYVMPMPSARENGDWVVYVHLMRSVVELIEEEKPVVFRPLTAEYYLAPAEDNTMHGHCY
ncbi:coniferyl alcohol acyltransferase-like [Typha latifolia]|uniref:coniferyl alcohol acyltransferase-like n=1 Tax=Typha latifolia TaxID=4733 RepID=UPI003C2D1176